MRLSFDRFDSVCQDLIGAFLASIRAHVLLHLETTDDMDGSAFLQLGETLNLASFPCDDTMPGDLDDLASIPRGVAGFSGDGEVGNFRVSELFDVNASDDAPDFDFVQLFHDGQ